MKFQKCAFLQNTFTGVLCIVYNTLVLLSLATAKRVGEIQALAKEVLFKRNDAYLSYPSEFRSKTESESNPLQRYFVVKSLKDS